MSSVVPVAQTRSVPGDELTADHAWVSLRRYGLWPLARESFTRFRYGDGFSHSRALGLQLCLAAIPLVIALVGLTSDIDNSSVSEVLRETIFRLTPGASDALLSDTLEPLGRDGGEVALWLGLAFAFVALTTGMGQLERGANRIYGIQRDRPALVKYGRAAVMAILAGSPAMAGFVLLVSAGAFGDVVEQRYGLDDDVVSVVVWPLGAAMLLGAITLMLRYSPRRRQPGWSWLVLGGGVVLALWMSATAALAAYLELSTGFGAVYGPLTGIIALLLWAQLTAGSIFFGLAVSGQLEAASAGNIRAAAPDRRP